MRTLILILVFTFACKAILAQVSISGYITDSLNNPVPFANVYLQNTTIGDDTDNKGYYTLKVPKEGFYELVVSSIGYQTKTQTIQVRNKNVTINIRLSSNPLSLNEVVVEAKNKNRIRNYATFLKLFIGTSPNAKLCKIHNLKDLRIYGDDKGNITRGYSVKPLEIENKALGYLIKYQLDDFSYNDSAKLVKFSGKQFYIPLIGSENKNKIWKEISEKEYYGSQMHFLRSLFSESAERSGFKLNCFKIDSITKLIIPTDSVFEYQLEKEKTLLHKNLFYHKPILVNYISPTNKSILYESIIQFADTVILNESGNLIDPYALTFTGKMGNERIADKLPYDFYPESYDSVNISSGIRTSNQVDKIILPAYENYYSNSHEQVYTHFNKSCYLPGEVIWFTNYILNQTTGKPSLQTKILYADLYGPNGKLIESKILKVQSGIADNSFKLPDIPGSYTFKAYTNWMKNYELPVNYSVSLEVIGNSEKPNSVSSSNYDIQFLAEGGTFLAGTINRVGVKALDSNGKAIILNGEIIDEKNLLKTEFKLNRFGLGDFRIIPKSGVTYRAKVQLPDGNEQYFDLPKVEEKGIIISVNNNFKDKVAVQITSNPQTVADGMNFHVLIHHHGNTFKTASINLSAKKPAINFFLKDSEIANGSNCITIFNQNFEPVAEKIFFKLKDDILARINLQQELKNDSVEFTVVTTDSLGNPLPASLSLSILPGKSVSDSFFTSLYAEALLKPGLNGYIENPSYYFEKKDDEHSKALDLLMLTQGWRKYDWKSIVSNKTLPYPFETSFSIAGKVENIADKDHADLVVSVVSPRNNLLLINNIDFKGEFLFPELSLEDKSVIIVSTNTDMGKSKNLKLTSSVFPFHKTDSLIQVNLKGSKELEQTPNEEFLNLLPNEILLQEAVVTAKAKKNPFDGATYRPGPTEKIYEVTKENYFKYPTLERLLSSEFNVSIRRDTGYYYFRLNRGRSSDSVFIVIDDINFRNDYDNLNRVNIDAIEAISVVENGFPVFEDVAAIIIKTRRVPIDFGQVQFENENYLNVKGFSTAAKYYTPQYKYLPETSTYQKYATIFWKPDIFTNQDGKATFRFAIPKGMKEIKVRTEGFSENGNIFVDNRLINLNVENPLTNIK